MELSGGSSTLFVRSRGNLVNNQTDLWSVLHKELGDVMFITSDICAMPGWRHDMVYDRSVSYPRCEI